MILVALPQSSAAAPTWLGLRNLSLAGNGGDLSIALDAAGDAFAVWKRSGTAEAAQRPAGGIWSAVQRISGTCLDARGVQLAISPAGRAVAVWECPKGGNTIVQASTRAPGGSWSAPHDLSAPGQDAHAPQVALDRAGEALAVWARSNGTDVIVQAALQRANGAWLNPEDVSGPGFDVDRPDVALAARGNGVAVWQASDGSSSVIQAAARTGAGSWSTPQTLSSGGYAERPQVGVDAAGYAVAVWCLSSMNLRVQAAVRPAGGAWAAAQTLSRPGADAFQPQVAVNSGGNAVAVWRSFDGLTSVIQATSRSRDVAWGAVQSISPRSPDLGAPRIAIDPKGDAVIVWRGLRSARERIQSARRPARGTWSAPALISPAGRDADLPDVALDSAGNGAALWQSGNGVASTVQAAGLDAAGPVLGRFRMTGRRTPGSRLSFRVSPFDVWSKLRGQPRWSFGDGASARGRRVTHAYRNAGTYTVRVRQADSVGNSTTATRRIVIAPPCVVPAVVGKTLAAAKAAIRRGHCSTGRVSRAHSARMRKGRVLAQRPGPGGRLANGAAVSLVVSLGR